MVCEQAFTLRNIGAVLPEPDFIWKRLRITSNCQVSALSMPLPNVLLQCEHMTRRVVFRPPNASCRMYSGFVLSCNKCSPKNAEGHLCVLTGYRTYPKLASVQEKQSNTILLASAVRCRKDRLD